MQMIPVILSGGSGSRLWPLSRKSHPKPFVCLPDGETLMYKTLQRVLALKPTGPIVTITNRDYYFLTRDTYTHNGAHTPTQLPELVYLLEPKGRNTAPAMAAAALWATEQYGTDTLLLFLPSDHIIAQEDLFIAAVHKALALAEQGYLVTFGMTPDHAETGYGYIEQGVMLAHGHKVTRFVEKPAREEAQQYVESGCYLWNSGMFCMRAQELLTGLSTHVPAMVGTVTTALKEGTHNGDTWELSAEFAKAEDISIDYALMEKADNVAVIGADIGWNDLGSWTAYGDMMIKDDAGNQVQALDSVLLDTRECLVHSPHRLVTLLGVEDLLVVDTPDALMIAHKSRAQEVKTLVQTLQRQNHASADTHRTVHRPWGTYTVLEEGSRFKIKRIVVKPQGKLSLQMHHHRSEHWIVVSGTAQIVNGDVDRLIHTNESTFIPAGHAHRLINPGVIPLVMIEVQSGEYLGEDDIVRFQDMYGRIPIETVTS